MLGTLAAVLIAFAGLLYTIGATSSAKRLLLLGILLAVLSPLLLGAVASVHCRLPSTDGAQVALLLIPWLLGLIGAGHAYLHFKKGPERRRRTESLKRHAPEPVPELAFDESRLEQEDPHETHLSA